MKSLNLSKIAVGVVLIASLITIPNLYGADRGIFDAGVVSNGGEAKTDFHIKITTDTPTTVNESSLKPTGGTGRPPTSITGNGTSSIELNWDLPIAANQSLTWYYEATQRENNTFTTTKSFTPKQSPTDIPTLGLRVEPSGDTFLLNGYESAVEFDDLRLLFPADLNSNAVEAFLSNPLLGIPNAIPSGIVPSASPASPGELFVGNFPLSPGDFFEVRFDSVFVDQGFSALESTTVLGHEHQSLPDSGSTLLLLCLALLVLKLRPMALKD